MGTRVSPLLRHESDITGKMRGNRRRPAVISVVAERAAVVGISVARALAKISRRRALVDGKAGATLCSRRSPRAWASYTSPQ